MPTPPLNRRRLLQMAAAGLLGAACGCSQQGAPTGLAAAPSRSPSPTPSPPAPPSAAPALPPVAPWRPSPRETLPELKTAAADLAQQLCTRVRGETTADALGRVADRLSGGVDSAAALRVLAPLDEGVAASGAVVYPQFGGLVPLGAQARSASVMVVVRQSVLAPGGTIAALTRVMDLRMSLVDGRWLLSEVASAGGEPVDRPRDLPPAAARVLDDPRIDLPNSARWDIHSGLVSPQLLDVLSAAAAELGEVGVTVLATGHPRNVFGTDRVSSHTVGRAVDVWRVGPSAVVDDRSPGGPTQRLQAVALLHGQVSQVGSPPGTDQDGAGRRSFDDLVHEDHLHLAVRG